MRVVVRAPAVASFPPTLAGARNVLHRSAPRDDGVLVDRSGGDVGWRRTGRWSGVWTR